MSKGAWVNENKYSPGKRHYYPDGVTRTDMGVDKRSQGDRQFEYHRYSDIANGKSLCGQRPLLSNGYVCYVNGRKSHSMGGLSSKETVNLLQSNLCSYCRKQYIADRPALKEAVEAVQKAQVLSA